MEIRSDSIHHNKRAEQFKKDCIRQHGILHTLRHGFATNLVEVNMALHYIQSQLGHTRTRTTDIYSCSNQRSITD